MFDIFKKVKDKVFGDLKSKLVAKGKVFWDRKVKELGNADLVEGRESGGMSLEELKEAYPELAKLAGV